MHDLQHISVRNIALIPLLAVHGAAVTPNAPVVGWRSPYNFHPGRLSPTTFTLPTVAALKKPSSPMRQRLWRLQPGIKGISGYKRHAASRASLPAPQVPVALQLGDLALQTHNDPQHGIMGAPATWTPCTDAAGGGEDQPHILLSHSLMPLMKEEDAANPGQTEVVNTQDTPAASSNVTAKGVTAADSSAALQMHLAAVTAANPPVTAADPSATAASPSATAANPPARAANPSATAAKQPARAADPSATAAGPFATTAGPFATTAGPPATAAGPPATGAGPPATAADASATAVGQRATAAGPRATVASLEAAGLTQSTQAATDAASQMTSACDQSAALITSLIFCHPPSNAH